MKIIIDVKKHDHDDYDVAPGEPPCTSSCGCMSACEENFRISKRVEIPSTFSDNPICGRHDRSGTSKLCSAFSECCKSTPEVVSHKKDKPVRSLAFSAADELCETSLAPIFLANLGDPDLAEKVSKIKLKCETERKEAEAENSAGSDVKSLLTQMMGAATVEVTNRRTSTIGVYG